MTDITNRSLPPPKNWQGFERMCFDLYSRLWKTNDADMNGRRGQPQAGVDVYGTDRVEGGRFVGVQCKGKDQDYRGALTEDELRAEIEKAETFVPQLDVFVVATSAPNDVKIQQIARIISKERTKAGLFEVRVQGWDTLQQLITDHKDVLTKHFSDFAPLDILGRIETGFAITETQGEQTLTLLADIKSQITAIAPDHAEAGDPLQARIIDAAKLTDDGAAHAALLVLQRIEEDQDGKISARNLYRLRSGFGFAHIAMGNLPAGIQDFRDAYAADPDLPNAKAILAIAELLAGDGASAFEHAKEVIAVDPTSYHAAAVILDTAPKDTTLDELEALVPAALHDRVDVQIGFALRARKSGEIMRAESYAKRAVALGPDDLRAISALVEALLEPVITIEGLALTRRVPPEAKSRFDEACELLQRAWEKLKTRDDVARHDHIVTNLINVLDVAGREAEAEQVLDQGLKLAPRSGPLLHRYAQKMAKAGDWQAVLTAIQSIPSSILEPQDELIQVHGLLRTGNAENALTQARALQDKCSEARFREAAAALRLEAAVELGSIQSELDATLSALPKSIVLRSVGMNLLKEDDPRRDVLVGEIETLVAEIDNPADRFHAAEALYSAKQFARAAELYEGLHGTDTDTLGLRRHLVALHLADHRLEARTLFESLSDEIKALPAYAEMGAAIYERAGLLKECREIIERYLLNPTDLEWRVQWISICQRTGDTQAIIEWLAGVKPDQDGPPRDLMLLAQAINHYTGDLKCLPIAYRALRSAYTDPQIHLGYMAGLFLFGRVGGGQIQTPEQVATDTAVLLVEKGGDGRLTRVIETEPNPQIERDEIASNDSLAVRLIGLRVGDEIELDTVAVEPARYVVSEIRNKYLHAHFRSLERFPVMFPENRAFGSIKIDEKQGR
jgi:cellulose synthase operon protein C